MVEQRRCGCGTRLMYWWGDGVVKVRALVLATAVSTLSACGASGDGGGVPIPDQVTIKTTADELRPIDRRLTEQTDAITNGYFVCRVIKTGKNSEGNNERSSRDVRYRVCHKPGDGGQDCCRVKKDALREY